ncbi:MAG: GntR family transcriptional regulator [Anaerolineales bacterium]|jgi:GntR family transcriptional regulator
MLTDNINRQSKVPYYQQLYEILRGKIDQGMWRPGDMIAPESELIESYQVSRSTVRQVLDMLVQEGLIYRQRGRGSFVAHPTLEQTMLRIVSFTEDMRQRGFEPGTSVLISRLINAPQEIAVKLDISLGEELAHVKRLRLADGEPMSIEESYMVHRYCRGVLEHDYAEQPLREILERDYGIRLVHARQTIRAILATKDQAKLLDVPEKSALLFIERVTHSQDAIPVEFLRIYYRADRYSLYNELHD